VSARPGAGAAVASQQLKAPPARPLRGSPTGPQRRVTPLVQTGRRAQPHARVALAGRVTPTRRLAPPRRPCAPGLPAWVPHPAAAGCVAVRGCPTVGLAVLQVLLMSGMAPISTHALDPSSRSYLIQIVLNRTRHVLPQSTLGPTTIPTQRAPRAWRRPTGEAPPGRWAPPKPDRAGGRVRGVAAARRNDSTSGGADAWRVLGVGAAQPGRGAWASWARKTGGETAPLGDAEGAGAWGSSHGREGIREAGTGD